MPQSSDMMQTAKGDSLNHQNAKNVYSSSSYQSTFFENLKAHNDQDRFCDVELVAGSDSHKIIRAHRLVLSSGSPYFNKMFSDAFNESKQKIIKFHSINFDILKMLIDFLYTGSIEISAVNVQEVLAAADMIEIPDIVTGCAQYLCRELHSSNALGILRFAEAHNCRELAESSISYINSHFPKVAEQDEILEVSQQMLMRLISSELIRVDSEYQVFSCAIRWIKHDIPNRKRFVFDILANVRLSLVPARLINSEISQCRDMSLKIALRSILKDLTSRKGTFVQVSVNPRLGAKKSIYIIGGSKRESTSGWTNDCIFESVMKYDIFRCEWVDVASMEVGRILPGTYIYLFLCFW